MPGLPSGKYLWLYLGILLLAAIASTILGMGMLVRATYIMPAIVTAPALMQLGVAR